MTTHNESDIVKGVKLDTDDCKCSDDTNKDDNTNPFGIIEGDSSYHNILVGKILQLMGKETNHISPIDYLYMTKIVQELVKR